jgi:hypothetical protein
MNAVRVRQVVAIITLALFGIVLGAALIVLSMTIDLFPDNRFSKDKFVQYGLSDLIVTNTGDNETTGLPSRTIEFKFATANSGQSNDGGLAILGSELEKQVKEEPAIYSIQGVGEGKNFSFQSVSPSDYIDDTYSDAYSTFNSLADRTSSGVKFNSEVDGNGHRLVTVSAETSSATGGSVLRSVWNNLVESMSINDNTTYRMDLTTEKSSVHAMFSTDEEVIAVTSIDPAVWENINSFTGGSTSSTAASPYGIDRVDLFISGVPGDNQTTLALTVPKGTTKTPFVKTFQEKAYADPKVALPFAITTTLTVAGEPTPFHIEYPTNRTW